ncbi:GNAT family N-acetyltransferase [Cognatilysobacter terrigena]|uniref:GNAT family N-acetyltransferase n=1 Tax=Cognatilysobacter terrigena TaxID=2488749 RepID=UPI001AAD1556|nr:GNAT family N-acetyltransferase [Lysobacter terrigena]
MSAAPIVAPLRPADRDDWQRLAEGYKAFYATPTTPAEYNAAWQRLMDGDIVHGLGARLDGRLVGIGHYLFHASTWADRVCYLQDLFTDEAARGRGVARALIEAVADDTRARGAARLYWLTQSHNATARALYDRFAEHRGFIRYDHRLDH